MTFKKGQRFWARWLHRQLIYTGSGKLFIDFGDVLFNLTISEMNDLLPIK